MMTRQVLGSTLPTFTVWLCACIPLDGPWSDAEDAAEDGTDERRESDDAVPSEDSPSSNPEENMLVELNRRRAEGADCGGDEFGPAAPLVMNAALREAARLHSQDMAAQDYFEHESLDGRSPWDRIADAGYPDDAGMAENIQGGLVEAADAVESLMGSPGHCRNIMEPRYRAVGIGFAESASATYRYYWTQDFGTQP